MVEKDTTYQELFDELTANAYAMVRVELSQDGKETITLTDLSIEVLGNTNHQILLKLTDLNLNIGMKVGFEEKHNFKIRKLYM